MKFTRDLPGAVTVRRVQQGRLRIGDTDVTDHVVLFRDTVDTTWTPANRDDVCADDLRELIDARPEMIVLGTGWTAALPPRDLVFTLAKKGIGIEVMDTPAACRTYNILVSEDRDVAAVLLID